MPALQALKNARPTANQVVMGQFSTAMSTCLLQRTGVFNCSLKRHDPVQSLQIRHSMG